ncbi:MAG: trypsin-like peptidase domain-containing protein [candidate division Zixibacteria bacterium]|nr:trypsin-like peptidase domain-containing protein [candidate division Zixibacteria bacterium]
MKKRILPEILRPEKGSGLTKICLLALVFSIFGFLLAPHLQIPTLPTSVAGDVVSHAGFYPVVENDGKYESPFVTVIEKVQNAVVNISARSRGEKVPWWFRGHQNATSSGSGFFFREDGYILTNNHVIRNAVELTVRTASGYQYEAKLVGADPETDLAVLKVDPEEEVNIIPFGNSDIIKVGDWAIAIGNPFPQQGLDRTVTVGVISALGRSNLRFGQGTPDYQSYIQTDASINPGNSGGPLLNLQGECVGVNAAISSPSGGSVGIGFAIPINLARAIVPDLIASGEASRGWLGIWFHEVSQREAKRQGLESVRGVTVDSVFADSPADKAGLLEGDIIVSLDGHPIENAGRLSVLVSTTKGSSVVPLEVVRNGEMLTMTTEIVDRETFLKSQPASSPGRDDFQAREWMGMELVTFTREIARAIGIRHIEGVYVRRVYPGSPAEYASIARGTVILQVNDLPVRSLDEVAKVVEQLGRPRRIPLIVQEPDGTVARKVVRP